MLYKKTKQKIQCPIHNQQLLDYISGIVPPISSVCLVIYSKIKTNLTLNLSKYDMEHIWKKSMPTK